MDQKNISTLAMGNFTRTECVLYKTIGNFIGSVTRHERRDHIGEIWNEYENVRKSYEIIYIGKRFFTSV